MRFLRADLALVLLAALSLGMVAIQGKGGRIEEERKFLELAAPAVASLPVNLGAWRMLDEEPLTERTLAILQCENHVNRTYGHESTGERVTMTVLLGGAGPLVSHSPEVCLPSAQYELISASQPLDLVAADGKKFPFLNATFRSKELGGYALRVYYAWILPDGSWVAPANPRWDLGGELGLIKLQFSTALTDTEAGVLVGELDARDDGVQVDDVETDNRDAVERFLEESGPMLKEWLAGSLEA